ncbi:MAG: hypothetical protein BMS9Abin12_0025 [Acidimicrobiia bacterium]|nr:MAG: hypothetical protein BMS9Abin12_0025 [Acidimicrobiia bacterium]
MKKNWTKIALALGPVIMLSSIVWEYARTKSSYTYLVQPWSIRGYDTIHGWIIVAAAVLLLISGLLTSMERSMQPRYSALIVVYTVVAATGFAAVFATDDITMTMSSMANVALSILLASSIALALRSLLGESKKWLSRALLTFIPLFLVFFFLFGATLAGNAISLPPWALVFVVFLVLGALSITIKPMDMGANRMIIIAAVMTGLVVLLSAGAIRQTLIDIQMETDQGNGLFGIAAQYKDTQAAGGWWLAGFGTFVMFVGSVGLWAKRRDIVAAIARADKQRVAAEKSAKEIADAAEAYARDHESATAN